MSRKSQIYGYDVVIAVAIITLLSFFLIETWSSNVERLERNAQMDVHFTKARGLLSQLLYHQGDPIDWDLNASTPNIIGLASRDGRGVELDKVQALLALDKNLSAEYLKSEYYFTIRVIENGTVHYNSSYNISEAEEYIVMRRPIMMNNSLYEFEFKMGLPR